MRLWTLHPTYLDSQGLIALWREALLARAVLRGRTKGYRHHPQLERFISSPSPRAAINGYLASIYSEAAMRGYQFDRSKLGRVAKVPNIRATNGQLRYEWRRLLSKLRRRCPALYRRYAAISTPVAHPIFSIVPGPIAEWERVRKPTTT